MIEPEPGTIPSGETGFTAVLTQIDNELDDELRSLLLLGTLAKARHLVGHLLADLKDPKDVSAAALVQNTLHFAEYAAEATHAAHKDWTRTGDKRVDDVWRGFTDMMEAINISAQDVPEDVRERLADGTATEDDWNRVKAVIGEKIGRDPNLLDVSKLKGQMAEAKAKPDEDNDQGIGQYL